jgi:hypothetical protein
MVRGLRECRDRRGFRLPGTGALSDATSLIAALPRAANSQAAADYEFSVRLRPGCIDRWGRFGVWLAGPSPTAFRPIACWLKAVDAPATAIAAQAAAGEPVRQGMAVALGDAGPEFRLYLHGRHAETQAQTYRSLRWHRRKDARVSSYAFYFAPETPTGENPFELVPVWARQGFAALFGEALMQRSSGFWVRRDANGRYEQVDLAFPWQPLAGTLNGLRQILDPLALPPDTRAWLDQLPVRHVAVPAASAADAKERAITLYVSASLGEAPRDEAELQAAVADAARASSDRVRLLLGLLPPLPDIGPERSRLDHFYSGDLGDWRAVLGEEMHYHHGLFDLPCSDPDDACMLAALRRAVSELYRFIDPGAQVYDVGCGWGGPLGMLARERRCRALGVTIARKQFRHIAALGLPVRWADAERTLPPGRFDCALLLESLEHMEDKPRLLRVLRMFASRLVMRTNCQDHAPPGPRFAGTMHMVSSAALRTMLENTGWRVRHWRDRRREAMPSVTVWHRRLSALGPTSDFHLETQRAWCARVVRLGDEWAGHNPLMEIVAE